MKKNILTVFSLFLVLGWLAPLQAPAQMSLEVSPIRAEHQIEAGASETNVIQVHNAGSQADPGQGLAARLEMNRKGEVSLPGPGSTPGSLSSWLEINPTDFRVEPGQIQGNTLHHDHSGRGQNRRLPGGHHRGGHAGPTGPPHTKKDGSPWPVRGNDL